MNLYNHSIPWVFCWDPKLKDRHRHLIQFHSHSHSVSFFPFHSALLTVSYISCQVLLSLHTMKIIKVSEKLEFAESHKQDVHLEGLHSYDLKVGIEVSSPSNSRVGSSDP